MTTFAIELALAERVATAAGELLLEHFRPGIAVAEKGWADPVTAADRAAEAFIRSELLAVFPDDGLWGEEEGAAAGRSDRVWVIDPLDGTANFAGHTPIFGVCLTLHARDAEPVGPPLLAVIRDPIRRETFSATVGGGASLNGAPIRASQRTTLRGAVVQIAFPRDRDLWEASLTLARRLTAVAPHARNIGSSALAQAWVAAGRLDGHARVSSGEFDIAGGNLLIEEAGGIVTDLRGAEYVLGGSLLAAGPAMHPQLLELGLG